MSLNPHTDTDDIRFFDNEQEETSVSHNPSCDVVEAHSAEDCRVNPGADDIIACTLVGDDEVSDAAVHMADRIIANLEASGFRIVPGFSRS